MGNNDSPNSIRNIRSTKDGKLLMILAKGSKALETSGPETGEQGGALSTRAPGKKNTLQCNISEESRGHHVCRHNGKGRSGTALMRGGRSKTTVHNGRTCLLCKETHKTGRADKNTDILVIRGNPKKSAGKGGWITERTRTHNICKKNIPPKSIKKKKGFLGWKGRPTYVQLLHITKYSNREFIDISNSIFLKI
ncbi:hypothetical protein JTB14_029957 [Gonioctena quinquepunctata]|nr:hypothetical protein JTB14_029957 [Gonioctena quinquepunctata]